LRNSPNIIIILLDTLRKDALGVYGTNTQTSNIDAFPEDAIVYGNCIAPSPWTVPSHASIFTGKYPSEHGVHETEDKKVPQLMQAMNYVKEETLPMFLRKSGYNTFGVSTNPSISPNSGFDLGFNVFEYFDDAGRSPLEREKLRLASFELGLGSTEAAMRLLVHGKFAKLKELYSVYRDTRKRMKIRNYPFVKSGDQVTNSILDSAIEQPFFLFVNFMEAHEPYTSYEFNKRYIPSVYDLFGIKSIPQTIMKKIKRQYYLEAQLLDGFFGHLIRYLKANQAYDNSLIIVTSDHGQALKEKQSFYGHGLYLFDEIIEVPLLIKYPYRQNTVSKKDQGGNETRDYQSLVGLCSLIKSCVEEACPSDCILTDEVCISESYGYHNSINFMPELEQSGKMQSLRKKLEVPRKAILKDGYKLVVNGLDGGIEEFTYHKKPIDPKERKTVLETILTDLQIFRGTEKFVLPTCAVK
jgi:arylsulfatase A-like enzyme